MVMKLKRLEEKASELRQQIGGKIFAFPVEEDDPFSKYTVVIHLGEDQYKAFPESLDIEEAAAAILETLKGFESEGWDADYGRNVRFVSYDAQINAPNVTMRRLKKENAFSAGKGYLEHGVDVMEKEDGEEGYHISPRGLVKFSYIEMIDNKNVKAIRFMDEYYKILAMNRYGKTAAAIKQEVRRMSKDAAIKWIEQTFERYITDPMQLINIIR